MSFVTLELRLDDIRAIGLSLLEEGLRDYALTLAGSHIPRTRLPILISLNEKERVKNLRAAYDELCKTDEGARKKLANMEPLLADLDDIKIQPNGLPWLEKVHAFVSGLRGKNVPAFKEWFKVATNSKNEVSVEALQVFPGGSSTAGGEIVRVLDRDIDEMRFVAAVMYACVEHRNQNSVKRPSSLSAATIEIALEKAYVLLDQGVRLPRVIKPLHKSARRDHQTYLSFADPGDGHLNTTVRDSRMLDGTIVHIEWIDRDNVDDKSVVEAYRLPALRRAARVRLHVGGETPCTAFIGRPVFEGAVAGQPMDDSHFRKVLLKSAHSMASICSSMFALGVVDCKVAMDGMTTRQAVDFMLAVAGNVVREPGVQMLSAAFNVNTPLIEDRTGQPAGVIINSRKIAAIGIDLVVEGKFNKIAWDGASNQQPSLPIISQLTMPELFRLVHLAHEKGLETYISAGLESAHMRWAVYSGVGGVGIGTSLHYVRPGDKLIGDVHRERVLTTLDVRNRAAKNSFGKAAAAMARLDWRAGEKSLSQKLDEMRRKLYEQLRSHMPEFEGRLHEAMALENSAKEEEADAPTNTPVGMARQRLNSCLKKWSDNEERNSEIDELVAAIEDFEHQEADAAKHAKMAMPASGDKDDEYLGAGASDIAKFEMHPLVERATRILSLHDSGETSASDKIDPVIAEGLKTALQTGRVDLLAELFAKMDERLLY